ncbi:multidrug ABC transporter ATP-binding protein [Ornatilinea apprima]|uniref:Multidrug ABC transporter ATP-binding protein n=1 Tax=Ornatilinea apprima TaxID=1134406 RepID=A0A0P6YB35_9CHLR|nr:ABC transporter ATP-binding protein [Ornatilinea apprima]KPL79134.1 multidrug ABC transporter ATP-binding protein [Ornatilinea apprima]
MTTAPVSPPIAPRRGPSHGGPGNPMAGLQKPRDARIAVNRLLAYLLPHRAALIGVFALTLFYTAFSLAGPYLMGVAIDQFIANKDLSGLGRVVLLMLGAYTVAWLSQVFADFVMAGISQKALQKIREDLFRHLQTLELHFFDQNPHGELMSRLTNDIDAINRAVSQNVTQLISNVLTVIGIMVMMLVLNVWLALAALLVIPLIMLLTARIASSTRSGFRDLQKGLGDLNATVEETISGQRVVTAFGRTESVRSVFNEKNESLYHASVKANTLAFLMMPITNVMGNLAVAILASLGGVLAINGLITVGAIAAFINYTQRFMQPIRSMANLYNTIQSALAGAERVFDILDRQPELMDAPGATPLEQIKGDVRFENVNFHYVEGVPVIKNMSLHASPGQTIALVGPTGAGKTTIVNLLTRFYDIQSGSIQIDGRAIDQVQKDSLRRQLGIVLQDTYLFTGTVMENIRYGRLDASDEEVYQAARLASADTFIHRLPQGYQTQLSERGSNLSQGQRQLLAIARAILADPAILILDEATSSVDTRTEAKIQKGLLELMKGRTSFVIAHRLSTIREADQVLVIKDGEIIERGSHNELLDLGGFYNHLYLSQFKGQVAV